MAHVREILGKVESRDFLEVPAANFGRLMSLLKRTLET